MLKILFIITSLFFILLHSGELKDVSLKKLALSNSLTLSDNEKEYLKDKKTIKMCVDPNWMPFEKIENGKHIGLASDYMKIIEKTINIPITLIETKSWNESIEKAKNRECDIFSMVPIIEKRKKYMNFTSSYLDIPMVIATKIDKHFIDDIEYILNKKIGIVKGYSISNILKEKYPNINIIDVKSINDGLLKVESGKIFAFIDNLATINHMINKNFMGILKVSGRLDNRLQYRVATRNDEPILNTIFDKIIKNIDAATNEKIFTKWVNFHNKETIIDYTLIWQVIGIFVIIILIGSSFLFISKRNNKKLEELLDTTVEGIAIFQDGKLIKANTPCFTMYGYDSMDEIKGKEAFHFFDETQLVFVQEQLKKDQVVYEVRMKRKDGTLFPALVKGTNLSSNIRVSSVVDITELKETYSKLELLNINLETRVQEEIETNKQQQLVMLQQSRYAQMGEMISMIAHQWRQPLNNLSLIIQGASLKYKLKKFDDTQMLKLSQDSKTQITQMSQTIDDFRYFFKPDKDAREFSINATISHVLILLKPVFNQENIVVETHMEDDILIKGFPNELGQVLINILNNAKDALVENNGTKKKHITIVLKKENDKAVISIEDNAGGIEDDVIDKIFDPYFSTKEEKNGTGLGLYMSKSIIKAHSNGILSVENSNNGAVFKIILGGDDE